MKKFWLFMLVVVGIVSLGVTIRIPSDESPVIFYNGTFANSQVDTIYYVRPVGLSALAFSAHFKDSLSITNVIVRRMVNGELMAVQAGDTLTAFNAKTNTAAGLNGTTANPSYAATNTVTLAPLADSYVFIATYAGSANGTTNAKVTYAFQQTLN